MIGVNFEDDHVTTGFGNHLARPILRDEWHENLTFEEGVKLLEKCMRVLLYRDRSAVNKLQVWIFLMSYNYHGSLTFPFFLYICEFENLGVGLFTRISANLKIFV